MDWQKRLQESIRKKNEEFEKDDEKLQKAAEKRDKIAKMCKPIIEEAANIMGVTLSDLGYHGRTDAWGWSLELRSIRGYSESDRINIAFTVIDEIEVSRLTYISTTYSESVPYSCYEDGNLKDKLREAIARCVEANHCS